MQFLLMKTRVLSVCCTYMILSLTMSPRRLLVTVVVVLACVTITYTQPDDVVPTSPDVDSCQWPDIPEKEGAIPGIIHVNVPEPTGEVLCNITYPVVQEHGWRCENKTCCGTGCDCTDILQHPDPVCDQPGDVSIQLWCYTQFHNVRHYKYVCCDGYEENSDNVCVDIDECASDGEDKHCESPFICENREPGFACVCPGTTIHTTHHNTTTCLATTVPLISDPYTSQGTAADPTPAAAVGAAERGDVPVVVVIVIPIIGLLFLLGCIVLLFLLKRKRQVPKDIPHVAYDNEGYGTTEAISNVAGAVGKSPVAFITDSQPEKKAPIDDDDTGSVGSLPDKKAPPNDYVEAPGVYMEPVPDSDKKDKYNRQSYEHDKQMDARRAAHQQTSRNARYVQSAARDESVEYIEPVPDYEILPGPMYDVPPPVVLPPYPGGLQDGAGGQEQHDNDRNEQQQIDNIYHEIDGNPGMSML